MFRSLFLSCVIALSTLTTHALASCCTGSGINEASLRAADVGQPLT